MRNQIFNKRYILFKFPNTKTEIFHKIITHPKRERNRPKTKHRLGAHHRPIHHRTGNSTIAINRSQHRKMTIKSSLYVL